MTGKFLGKIISAEYGLIPDHSYMIGLQLTFQFDGNYNCGDGGKYTVNISDECKWNDPYDRDEAIVSNIDRINKILTDAKCNYVSELIGKPIEIVIENHGFKDFRILTEVL